MSAKDSSGCCDWKWQLPRGPSPHLELLPAYPAPGRCTCKDRCASVTSGFISIYPHFPPLELSSLPLQGHSLFFSTDRIFPSQEVTDCQPCFNELCPVNFSHFKSNKGTHRGSVFNLLLFPGEFVPYITRSSSQLVKKKRISLYSPCRDFTVQYLWRLGVLSSERPSSFFHYVWDILR